MMNYFYVKKRQKTLSGTSFIQRPECSVFGYSPGFLLPAVLLITLLLAGCQSFQLQNIETAGTREILHRGQPVLETDTRNVRVEASGRHVQDELEFTLFIDNSASRDINLRDHDITVYEGNYESGRWYPIQHYTAQEYYDKTKSTLDTEISLVIVKNIIGSFDDGNIRTETTIRFTDEAGKTSSALFEEYSYSERLAYLERRQRLREVRNHLEYKDEVLKTLRNTLLYPSDIPPGNTYWGTIYSKIEKGPDYRLQLDLDGRKFNFIFARSDREEIINPLMDKERPQGVLYYTWQKEKPFGFGISMNHHRNFGFYLQNNSNIPDYKGQKIDSTPYSTEETFPDGYEPTSQEPLISKIEPAAGINAKLADHLWIKGGLGIQIESTYVEAVKTDKTDSERVWLKENQQDYAFLPHAGADLVIGNIAVGGMYLFDGWNFPGSDASVSRPAWSWSIGISF